MGEISIMDLLNLSNEKYAKLMDEVEKHKDTHQGAYDICKAVENIRLKMEVK